jgi:hypothetical protein
MPGHDIVGHGFNAFKGTITQPVIAFTFKYAQVGGSNNYAPSFLKSSQSAYATHYFSYPDQFALPITSTGIGGTSFIVSKSASDHAKQQSTNAQIEAGGWGFSASASTTVAHGQTSNGKAIYATKRTTISTFKVGLIPSTSKLYQAHPDLREAIARLPSQLTYDDFLDMYGTHYITESTFGGEYGMISTISSSSSGSTDSWSVQAAMQGSMFGVSVGASGGHSSSTSSMSSKYDATSTYYMKGGDPKKWVGPEGFDFTKAAGKQTYQEWVASVQNEQPFPLESTYEKISKIVAKIDQDKATALEAAIEPWAKRKLAALMGQRGTESTTPSVLKMSWCDCETTTNLFTRGTGSPGKLGATCPNHNDNSNGFVTRLCPENKVLVGIEDFTWGMHLDVCGFNDGATANVMKCCRPCLKM